MCTTCGCGSDEHDMKLLVPNKLTQKISPELLKPVGSHVHLEHSHGNSDKIIAIEKDILAKNNSEAERNSNYFNSLKVKAFNIISSPGSGKTTLLEKTILALGGNNIFVIEGDQQTTNDAERIKSAGAPAVQINTGTGCHLDAAMVYNAAKQLKLTKNAILFIENIGNLVCPSLFELGETYRIVLISVTEGDDKPLKYPTAFANADICVINKTDLLPYVDFSVEKVKTNALKINPNIRFFEVSAKTGDGMNQWLALLNEPS